MGDDADSGCDSHATAQRLRVRRPVGVACGRSGHDVDCASRQGSSSPRSVHFGRAHEDGRRNAGHDPFDDLDGGGARQLEVEDDGRRPEPLDQGDGIASGPRLADHAQARIGGDRGPKEPALDHGVFDQDNRDRRLLLGVWLRGRDRIGAGRG